MSSLSADQQKRAAAEAAMAWVEPQLKADTIVGVGTGSTADHFIDLLAAHRERFAGAVASSSRSADRLARQGVKVYDLNDLGELPMYIDGADEITDALAMTKGGGGALTREKIVAAASRTFVCIADGSKRVERLGRFPLPVEVIPMACAQVTRALEAVGREARLGDGAIRVRPGSDGKPLVTDNGNWILDVSGWTIADPVDLEARIGAIVGVVESGLFAHRGADLLLLATDRGVERRTREDP